MLHKVRKQHATRLAKLPWAELEAEAERRDCSAADIFFDRAGHPGPEPAAPTGPRPS